MIRSVSPQTHFSIENPVSCTINPNRGWYKTQSILDKTRQVSAHKISNSTIWYTWKRVFFMTTRRRSTVTWASVRSPSLTSMAYSSKSQTSIPSWVCKQRKPMDNWSSGTMTGKWLRIMTWCNGLKTPCLIAVSGKWPSIGWLLEVLQFSKRAITKGR